MSAVDDMRHEMVIEPTDQVGMNTGRRRWRVECRSCRALVHDATTSPSGAVRSHIEGDAAYEQPLFGGVHDDGWGPALSVEELRTAMETLLRGLGRYEAVVDKLKGQP